MIGHAELGGDDDEYRWLLTRRWARGSTWFDAPRPDSYVLFIGLNPSTASAAEDDATIRRMIGFAKLWGHNGIAVANLFAFRATKPKVLYKSEDPHGIGGVNGAGEDRGLKRLVAAASGAAVVVACWGANARRASDWPPGMWRMADQQREWTLAGRASQVGQALAREGISVMCLGTSNGGHPLHPVRLPYANELEPFDVLKRYPPESPLELFCACGHSFKQHDPDPAAERLARKITKARDAKAEVVTMDPHDFKHCNGVVQPHVPWSRDERYGAMRCRCEQFELPKPEDYVDGPPRTGRDKPTLRVLQGGGDAE